MMSTTTRTKATDMPILIASLALILFILALPSLALAWGLSEVFDHAWGIDLPFWPLVLVILMLAVVFKSKVDPNRQRKTENDTIIYPRSHPRR